MPHSRRSQERIKEDFEKIEKAANVATTITEISKMTRLSSMQIRVTLSKYPGSLFRIKHLLAHNKEKKNFTSYVIDASIMGVSNIEKTIAQIRNNENAKIILTSITIKELDMMQKFDDAQAYVARHILALAVEEPENFSNIVIDETLDTPDDCIIKYCANHKENLILLTSDKTMVLKARAYSVQVEYLEKKLQENQKNMTKHKANTLYSAQKVGDKLLLSCYSSATRQVGIYANNNIISSGVRELNIGDNVFIATKRVDYISFTHFRVTSLFAENNCQFIYGKRFYNGDEIDVPELVYKDFITRFLEAKPL